MLQKLMKVFLSLLALILISLFAILLIPYLQFKSTKVRNARKDHSMEIVAHRGASGLAPENTMAAFEKALSFEVDVIELDIHLSKDDKLVVIHDSNLKRTTGYDEEVESLTLEEIRSYDAGSWFSQDYDGERIPTLDQVLKKIGGRCTVLIEIKWPKKGIYDGIVKEVLKSIDKYQAQDWTIVQSFEPRYLHQLHSLRPEIESHQLLLVASNWFPIYYDRNLKWQKFKPLPFVESINIYANFLSIGMNWKTPTRSVGVYTINDIEDMIRAQSLGASYLITDRPDLAVDLFK